MREFYFKNKDFVKKLYCMLILIFCFFVNIPASAKTAYVFSQTEFIEAMQNTSINDIVIIESIKFINSSFTFNPHKVTIRGAEEDLYLNLNNSYGLLLFDPMKITIKNIDIVYAGGSYDGSALYVSGETAATLQNLDLFDNSSSLSGGAIINNEGSLTLKNVELYRNTVTDDGVIIKNTGTLNLYNSISDNEMFYDDAINIYNDGVVNATRGNIQFPGGVKGNGYFYIKGAKILCGEDSVFYQDYVKISKGRLAVANAASLQVDKLVNNVSKGIYLDHGTDSIVEDGQGSYKIENSATLSNTNISGKGSTVIQGNIVLDSTSTISQKILIPNISEDYPYDKEVVYGKNISTGATRIVITGGHLDDDGNYEGVLIDSLDNYTDLTNGTYSVTVKLISNSLTANADSILGTVVNDSTLTLTGGTITKTIKGSGRTIIEGDVLNNAKIYQNMTINKKDADNNKNYTFTTNASLFDKKIEIVSSGDIVLTGGTLSASIIGAYDANVIISGDVVGKSKLAIPVTINDSAKYTTNGSNILYKITNNGTLRISGGTIYNEDNDVTISGTGKTQITGKVINNALISQYIDVTKKGKLTVNANKLKGNLINEGTLYLTGGTLDVDNDSTRAFAVQNSKNMTITNTTISSDIDNWAALTIKNSKISEAEADDSGIIENYKTLKITSSKTEQNVVSGNTGLSIYNACTKVGKKVYAGSITVTGAAKFSDNDNSDSDGGVIVNIWNTSIKSKPKITFNGNYSSLQSSYDTVFQSNKAKNGGAVVNLNGTLSSSKYVYSGNTATEAGGAIYNDGTFTDKNGYYSSNTAVNGGAVYNLSKTTISSAAFDGNTAAENGGALYNTGTLKITSSDISSNTAASNGGGIYNAGSLTIERTAFDSNSADGDGGAIYNTGSMTVNNTSFSDNKSDGSGGAVYIANGAAYSVIKNSEFSGNSAVNGGAVYVGQGAFLQISDTNFYNNTASNAGGAVYADENSTVNILAVKKNITFEGNTANGTSNSIYLNNAALNLQAAKKRTITINDDIAGVGTITTYGNVVISNKTTLAEGSDITFTQGSGKLKIMSEKSLANTSLSLKSKGVVDIANGSTRTLALNTLTLADDTTSDIAVDMDLKTKSVDKVTAKTVEGTGTLNVSKVNMVTNSKTPVTINVNEGSEVDSVSATTAESAEATYKLKSSIDKNGMLRTVAYGQKAKPCTLAAPVAAQLGGYLTQINSYDQAFMNMDMTMMRGEQRYEDESPKGEDLSSETMSFRCKSERYRLARTLKGDSEERQAELNSRYASAECSSLQWREKNCLRGTSSNNSREGCISYAPERNYFENGINYNSKGLWTRPYATFERVNLSSGPKVGNIAYGNFFGGDADMKILNNGWRRQFSAYIGYNGSTQDYDRQSIDQNGGTIGITEVWYKRNFFTGLTVNVGANVAQASTDLGRENIPMLMAGVASKTGYNFEFKNGKFIIQPSILLSYSFVHSFAHDNGRGTRVSSSPLHAIQVAPGVKFIFNLPKGWQPYLGVNMRWNIIDKTHFAIEDVTIPDMSIDPYVEYGVGLQRRWGERFTGYGQAMIRNGGRNGVMLSFGFKWAIGK